MKPSNLIFSTNAQSSSIQASQASTSNTINQSKNFELCSKFETGLIQRSTAKIIENVGFTTTNYSCLSTMSSIFEKYLDLLCKKAHCYADYGKRSNVNFSDVSSTFRDLNVNLSEIHDYIREVGSFSDNIKVPEFLVSKIQISKNKNEKEEVIKENEENLSNSLPVPDEKKNQIMLKKMFPNFQNCRAVDLGFTSATIPKLINLNKVERKDYKYNFTPKTTGLSVENTQDLQLRVKPVVVKLNQDFNAENNLIFKNENISKFSQHQINDTDVFKIKKKRKEKTEKHKKKDKKEKKRSSSLLNGDFKAEKSDESYNKLIDVEAKSLKKLDNKKNFMNLNFYQPNAFNTTFENQNKIFIKEEPTHSTNNSFLHEVASEQTNETVLNKCYNSKLLYKCPQINIEEKDLLEKNEKVLFNEENKIVSFIKKEKKKKSKHLKKDKEERRLDKLEKKKRKALERINNNQNDIKACPNVSNLKISNNEIIDNQNNENPKLIVTEPKGLKIKIKIGSSFTTTKTLPSDNNFVNSLINSKTENLAKSSVESVTPNDNLLPPKLYLSKDSGIDYQELDNTVDDNIEPPQLTIKPLKITMIKRKEKENTNLEVKIKDLELKKDVTKENIELNECKTTFTSEESNLSTPFLPNSMETNKTYKNLQTQNKINLYEKKNKNTLTFCKNTKQSSSDSTENIETQIDKSKFADKKDKNSTKLLKKSKLVKEKKEQKNVSVIEKSTNELFIDECITAKSKPKISATESYLLKLPESANGGIKTVDDVKKTGNNKKKLFKPKTDKKTSSDLLCTAQNIIKKSNIEENIKLIKNSKNDVSNLTENFSKEKQKVETVNNLTRKREKSKFFNSTPSPTSKRKKLIETGDDGVDKVFNDTNIKKKPIKTKKNFDEKHSLLSTFCVQNTSNYNKEKSLTPCSSAAPVDDGDEKVWICPVCSVAYVDGAADMVGCDGCDQWFHWHCVGLLIAPPENKKWFCSSCTKKKKKKT